MMVMRSIFFIAVAIDCCRELMTTAARQSGCSTGADYEQNCRQSIALGSCRVSLGLQYG